MSKRETVIAYKAMNADMTCRGHKFEVGKSYAVEGETEICGHGFHACPNPLDVLDYYDLCGSRFARVTISGDIKRDGQKLCGTSIVIDAELTLHEWIDESIKWLLGACKGESVTSTSGDYSQLAASGKYSQLAASGRASKLAASGHGSQLAASGRDSNLAASGYGSKLATSGYGSQLAASGQYSKLAASGRASKLAASGYSSQLAASGDGSQLAASGPYSNLATSGHGSTLALDGSNSAAAAVGNYAQVKAVEGCPIAICEYDNLGKPIGFATGIAGKDFPADTWVEAHDGELVEVRQ